MSSESLNVIALISGGKDSFFNLLHCIHHGHRIVALANLFPADDGGSSAQDGVQYIHPAQQPPPAAAAAADEGDGSDPQDLNSFMYQTVGHQVIPLYAAATGLPLYRQPIRGVAVHHERDYDYAAAAPGGGGQGGGGLGDETESIMSLLQAIKARHPEANAVCSGAILSTYQRTRVESVALRLGLVPLAYLWKYPVLPPPPALHAATAAVAAVADEAQLLHDMAAAGLEARIIKVASAGLDESHLWEQVSSSAGVNRVKSALRKFGAAEGAALGEGGEFETLVLDGPPSLFKRSIAVPEGGRAVIHEGGGSTWLMLRGARLQEKPLEADAELSMRVPDLLDSRFQSVLDSILDSAMTRRGRQDIRGSSTSAILSKTSASLGDDADTLRWSVLADPIADRSSIEAETRCVVGKIRELLFSASLDAAQITNTLAILRNMADFPKINAEYGKLFTTPNPPSRITISCGDLLPAGHNIAVHVTAPKPEARSGRDGLHVQSRSYWAPANIGPYSQAVDVAVTAQQEETGLRAVYVAGQIPLIPASMALPAPSETSLQMQIVLSLQHLWRIGQEMKVQFWTSAVAYFARSSSASDVECNAKLAGLAWELAHGSPEDDEDDENGPDPWDLKYNPQHMSLGGSSGQNKTRGQLPDWSIFTLRQQKEPETCIPPFFAVEIEELPRQSAVEWHAHTGLAQIGEGDAELVYQPDVGGLGWRAWHVVVRAPKAKLVYTVLAYVLPDDAGHSRLETLEEALSASYRDSVGRLGVGVSISMSDVPPYLVYIDTTANGVSPWPQASPSPAPAAVVPCRSIWSSRGERIGCVAMYRSQVPDSQ